MNGFTILYGMVEKWDSLLGPLRPLEPPGLLEPPRPLGPPVPQDPMDSRDPQDLWTLRHPGTSGPQNPWEITSTV